MKIEAIDLFCGIGGLTYGLRKAEIDVIAGLDNDESCLEIYETNNKNKFIAADISEYDFEELKSLYSDDSIRVLVGCAPCQPFSTHSNKQKNRENDERWNLIEYFVEAVRVINPHVISMENVRGLMATEVYNKFVKSLEILGYEVDADILYCPDYGIPQSRSRLVLVGSKLGKIDVPSPTHEKSKYRTVRNVLAELPELNAGDVDPSDPVHRAKHLSKINLNRIQKSKPAGSWKDWPEELLPKCYQKESGKTYVSVYGRMSWNAVSPTMTTQFTNYGSGRFGHPDQDRALTLREGAILQTFPKDYFFGDTVSMARTSRHIGNAVPPRLGFVIGDTIKKHIEHHYG
jgi:DNA (cytosine-5)-methyltransferase 1